MSTATALDIKEVLKQSAQMGTSFMIKDIKHLTDQQLTASPGGKAKCPLEVIAEVGLLNQAMADTMLGKEASTEDSFMTKIPAINTREKALAILESGTNAICEAIDKTPIEDFQTQVTAPWGYPSTKYFLASFAGAHAMYHDGQLNYVQAMNGDTEVHWMEE